MFLAKEKNKSLPLLQILTTLFIMLAPFALGKVDQAVYSYMLLLVTGALFIYRTLESGRFYVCVYHLFMAVLLCFVALSSFWVSNRGAHFVYLATISSVIFITSLVVDYFTETTEEKSQRRMMYMLSIGCILCALQNCIYWLTDIVPFGKKESFSQGMGNNHFLGLFMIVGIVVTYLLMKGNSRFRKFLFVLGIACMAFVFIMCKSLFAWILLVFLAAIYPAGKTSEKSFYVVSAVSMVVFSVVLILVFFSGKNSDVFKDVISYSTFFGRGGGFLSASEIFIRNSKTAPVTPGLIAVLGASSGLLGFLCAVVFTVKPILHFIKLRTWVSVLNVFLTVMIMFLPLEGAMTVLVLWAGITAYNEKMGEYAVKRNFRMKKNVAKKAGYATICIGVITAVFLCQRLMVLCGEVQYEKENYITAYGWYNSAAVLNVFDGESAAMAAKSLYKSGNIQEHYHEAITLVEKAQKRDNKNLSYNKLKAQIYHACGSYELAVQEYVYISSRAKINDEYNLLMVKSLYKSIEASPEGSAETVEVYDKIVKIAEETENPDYREKINNIAVDAQKHTRRRTEY